MPEKVTVMTGDSGRDAFDKFVHEGLPEGGDISFSVKEKATSEKRPAVCISWTTEVAPGEIRRVQAVTTLRALRTVLATFNRIYPED